MSFGTRRALTHAVTYPTSQCGRSTSGRSVAVSARAPQLLEVPPWHEINLLNGILTSPPSRPRLCVSFPSPIPIYYDPATCREFERYVTGCFPEDATAGISYNPTKTLRLVRLQQSSGSSPQHAASLPREAQIQAIQSGRALPTRSVGRQARMRPGCRPRAVLQERWRQSRKLRPVARPTIPTMALHWPVGGSASAALFQECISGHSL
jgi:hypothetical protein